MKIFEDFIVIEEVQERDWQNLLETLISKIEDVSLRENNTSKELKIIKKCKKIQGLQTSLRLHLWVSGRKFRRIYFITRHK